MTTLAAVIATIATAGLATDVTTNQGTSTQQDIVHIFNAANALPGHDESTLPADVDDVYTKWPTVIDGIVTTTDVPTVTSIGKSGGRFLADTRGTLTVTETGEDQNWRDVPQNRTDTLEAIETELFGDGNTLEDVDTNGFRSTFFIDEGTPLADYISTRNEGIIGSAVDYAITLANTANWNAVRAYGAGNPNLADANAGLIGIINGLRGDINNVLAEYDEAKAAITAGDL